MAIVFILTMSELRHREEKGIPDKMAIELGGVNGKIIRTNPLKRVPDANLSSLNL